MTLHVIGAGVGRTGTYSLKLAIDQLGLGRCHHMEEVILNMPAQVPHWAAAVSGHPEGSDLQRLQKRGRLANRRVLSGASLGLSIGEVRTDTSKPGKLGGELFGNHL
jgi:hypothetical protein